jgi:glycosyltransferase involved in cell wall biosynthesis
MSPRRIAMVHPGFRAPGGAEQVALDFAEALGTLDWEVAIVCSHWEPRAFGGRLDAFAPRLVPEPRIGLGTRPDPRALAALAAALRDCDVAMAHNHPANAYLGLAPVAAPRLWYCHEPHRRLHALETSPGLLAALDAGRVDATVPGHGTLARKLRISGWKRRLSPRHRGRRALDLAGVRRLDAVWANSGATARQVAALYGRDAEVFYPAVAVPAVLPDAARVAGSLRVLVMGGFGVAKGFGALLAGFARYAAGDPTVVLEVVGDGRERGAFEARVGTLGLGRRIRFHGRLADAELAALRRECHGFAALPVDEPFGLVFAEAAAAGLVTIAPDHGGPREIVLDGAAGLLADPFDAGSVAAAFARFAALSGDEREGLRRAAHDGARARFDRARLPQRLAAGLDALLAARRASSAR